MLAFLSKLFGNDPNEKKVKETALLEANVCPNCWGRGEYDGQFFDYAVDQTKSNINADKLHQKAFIQQFVETHVSGIQLKKGAENRYCPKCNRLVRR